MLRGKTSEFHQQPDTCSDSDIDSKNDTTTPLIPEPTRFPSHHDYVPPGVVPGNSTARIQGDFVVFLIGARANTPSAILDSRFGEIGNAMTAMRKELQDQPELGCLGAEDFISMYGDGSQILAVQYWRSVEHLHAYARGKGHVHVRAVPKFIKIAKDSPDFGAWHETFAVKSGDYETFYLNMPPFGLGNARETQLEQVPAKWRTMKQRMGRATDPNSLDPPEW
ncbi:hypothetical protein DFS34DRAFT_582546 [Phlyctochytrium arcticum]|nr:hypothetical protein DFS34DRAFT_582546 [Phlyctochytrium arcticum]